MSDVELLCTSKDDKKIYVDSVSSHAATHFADAPQLKELVIEVLENRNIATNKLEFDYDMKRIIGTCDVIEASENDEIVYAIRKFRYDQGYVPFIKNREAQDDSNISISLIANPDGTYQLSSAWIGTWDDPPFPQQSNATPESPIYWKKHALVWGSQEIEAGSETSVCPW